jgi:hypothetical protein
MTKKITKAAGISKLLKQGYTPAQIKDRMAVSESYIHAVKKQMAAGVGAEVETTVEEKIEPKHEPEVNVVDKVLDARADQYGSFMQGADIAVRIKGIMHNAIARKDMHMYPDQLLALDMIAVKISRIVNGNASHRDSWLDIAGYAKLVADRLGGVSR